jgi:hypothetical protein
MRRHICLVVIAILLPLPAGAEVILRSKCSLNPGKTFASVEAVFTEWRKLFEEEGFGDYRVRLLIPHAAAEARAGVFWIEGSSPDFERYGKAWHWWYTSPVAAAANASMMEVFTCDSTEVFRTGPSL